MPRTHHMFHRSAWPWRVRSSETATIVAYILGLAFVSCMFAAMATDWDMQGILWFVAGGIALVVMLLSMILRDIFEDMLCARLRISKNEHGLGSYARLSNEPPNFERHMPRLTARELLYGGT